MGDQWSPVCPKCGKLTNRVVEPTATQVLAGRLSPRALEGVMGQRERCPRCSTWFPLSGGTRWEKRATPFVPTKPEGRGAEMPDEPE